ncbi:MAG: serine/threonine protein kinase, partial [Verrucomicrobiales bacterium]|nr:serine/threonine protein kinase [Verrucomicrobiales bacterium]
MPRDPFLDQSQDSGGQQMPSLREGQWLFNRRYELKKPLGAGGMGVVWLARDHTEQIDVALKFLPSLLVLQEREMQRLREEVRAGKELRHPRLVATYGMELEDGIAAIVMEFVPGQTLRQKLDDAPHGFFETAEIQPWVADICTALDYLHEEAKRIHRDLKPANVMLDSGGRAKLMDFGISHRIKESVSRHSKTDEAASGAGGSSSTLAYASPQQISGKPSDKADDIYSLGAMLYELLTGTPPFFRGGLEAVGFQIKTEPVTPIHERRQELVSEGLNASVGEAVPPTIEKIILDSLEKDREKRPNSASKVAQSFSSSNRANTPSAPLTRSAYGDVGVQPVGDQASLSREGSSTSLPQPSPDRLKPQTTPVAANVAQSFSSSNRTPIRSSIL